MDIRIRKTDGMRCYNMADMEEFIKEAIDVLVQ